MRTGVVGMWLVLATSSCHRKASAQEVVAVARDPFAPVRCYEIATKAQLSDSSALNLCSGAINDSPGVCYAQAVDTQHELSTQKIQQLCTRATSLDPLECYRRLDANGKLTEDQMIAYCVTTCGIGPPPPQSASPDCVAGALEQANLSLQHAGELCQGSSSAWPVQCYLAGANDPTLAESNLIQLCAEYQRCQYYTVAPAGY